MTSGLAYEWVSRAIVTVHQAGFILHGLYTASQGPLDE